MLNEYDEKIEKFLDDEAENYIPLEEKLLERGIDFETAVIAADKFFRKFDTLLSVRGIEKNNISHHSDTKRDNWCMVIWTIWNTNTTK